MKKPTLNTRPILPRPGEKDHKYTRGHVLIMGGKMPGAARLAMRAARRMGAGMVTVAAPADSLPFYTEADPGILIQKTENIDLPTYAETKKLAAVLIGCGYGVGDQTCDRVRQVLALNVPTVLDADGLTSFKTLPPLHEKCVLTPHEGEFAHIFFPITDRVENAVRAAKQAGAVVVLKGAETVIAHPDGRAVVNKNAPAWLASAGTGDVLAGMILGLLGQGMAPFEAACAAVWLHGEAATRIGRGLIAEDIPEKLSDLLKH